jgi:hypothetical protein
MEENLYESFYISDLHYRFVLIFINSYSISIQNYELTGSIPRACAKKGEFASWGHCFKEFGLTAA